MYPRLAHSILEAEAKNILFSLTHNHHPCKDCLFQQQRVQDACWPFPSTRVQDRGHLFCSCHLVSEVWLLVCSKLLQLLPKTIGTTGTSGEDFILLRYPKDTMDKEVLWLIGNYCDIVKKTTIGKKRRLGASQVAGLVRSQLADPQIKSCGTTIDL